MKQAGVGDAEILQRLGAPRAARLGEGGEAVVYALDAQRVLRIHRTGVAPDRVGARGALLAELQASTSRVPFAIPEVIEELQIDGRFVTVERRLPGASMAVALATLEGDDRKRLVRDYLVAAAAIRKLVIDRPWWGDLCDPDPIRTASWKPYLEARARAALGAAGPELASLDAAALAAALPDADAASLVHLDVFPGNVLCQGPHVTAVIDFGAVSLCGDPRLDPLLAVVYLDETMSPTAREPDREVAHDWLRERDLDRWYPAAERWTAAYWAPAGGRLARWARELLLSR